MIEEECGTMNVNVPDIHSIRPTETAEKVVKAVDTV